MAKEWLGLAKMEVVPKEEEDAQSRRRLPGRERVAQRPSLPRPGREVGKKEGTEAVLGGTEDGERSGVSERSSGIGHGGRWLTMVTETLRAREARGA